MTSHRHTKVRWKQYIKKFTEIIKNLNLMATLIFGVDDLQLDLTFFLLLRERLLKYMMVVIFVISKEIWSWFWQASLFSWKSVTCFFQCRLISIIRGNTLHCTHNDSIRTITFNHKKWIDTGFDLNHRSTSRNCQLICTWSNRKYYITVYQLSTGNSFRLWELIYSFHYCREHIRWQKQFKLVQIIFLLIW